MGAAGRLPRVALQQAVAISIGLFLVGVTGGWSADGLAATPRRGGGVTIGIWQEPVTLLWPRHATPYAMSMLVMSAINEPLLAVRPDLEYEPRLLAEVPTLENGGISPDGKTYTLRLRPGLRWQDGRPVTMHDFVFTWKWILDPKNGAVYRRGWETISRIDVSPDGLTATVKLSDVYAPFVDNVLAHAFLLPEHYLTRVGDRHFSRNPLGNGPFQFVEWVSGSHVIVERNPNYWQRGKPYLDRIVFKVLPDRTVMLAQARTGEIQIGVNYSEAQLADLQQLRSAKLLIQYPPFVERWLFNTRDPSDPTKPHPIFSDVRARQAVILATDRPQMIATVLRGTTTVGVNMLMQTRWFNKALQPYPYDPKRAMQILDEAGWIPGPDGIRVKNGIRFSFTHSTTAGDPTRGAMQAIMQQNLADVGIEMKIQNYPPPRFFGSWATGSILYRRQFDMAGHSNGLTSLDPDLYTWWHSSSIASDQNPAGFNFTGWSSPEVDNLLEQVNRTVDPARRKALLDRVQEILHNEYLVMVMFNRQLLYSVHPSIQGINPNHVQAFVGFMWNVADWWVER